MKLEVIAGPPPHPGEVLRVELEARGWTNRDLAFVLGISEQQLSPTLSGKRSISPDMARALSDALEVSPRFFLNLQAAFDLENAKTPAAGVSLRGKLQKELPLREMVNRGWIEDLDPDLLEIQVSKFLEVTANDDGDLLDAFAAKKTSYEEVSPSQRAWVACARKLARKIDAPPLELNALRGALPKLKSLLIEPESISEVPEILRLCGVRLVVVEALPGGKIDGACLWLDEGSPVIALSTLYDRLDNFWFVLRHEIEHILRGEGKKAPLLDDLGDQENFENLPEMEKIANREAANFMVDEHRFNSFFARKNPYFSEKDVLGFASVIGVHPAIVVGRLQNRLKRYNFLRKHLVKVRNHLLGAVVYDGWGNTAVTGKD